MEQELSKQIVQSFAGAFKGLRLYPLRHPAIERHLQGLLTSLLTLGHQRSKVTMGLLEKTLVIEDQLFAQGNPAAEELSQLLQELELQGLLFRPGLTVGELQTLLALLQAGSAKGDEFSRQLQEGGVTHIEVVTLAFHEQEKRPRKIYGRALRVVENIFQDVRLGRIPSSAEAVSAVKSMAELTITDPHALFALSMLKDYDNYTFTHSVNVAVIALAVGRSCGLSEEKLRTLGLGALLHDLGKLKIDRQIINKPGRLTEEEFAEIRKHPGSGAELVAQMDGITTEVIDIVLGHHLRFNREGYPSEARQREVSPLTYMAAIADTYDAMTTLRAYQRPMTPRTAIEELQTLKGNYLHPEFVETFVVSLGTFPVGSLVRLETGEIGVVVWVDIRNPDRAQLKILFDADERRLAQGHRLDLDGSTPPRIVAELDPFLRGIDVTEHFR
ncbi:MAG: HD-GYP domain-containing protein [Desulfuromonadales bacterium]|nr:HD-GYP domain-containing protein [Desulfuromonadales bacterium]